MHTFAYLCIADQCLESACVIRGNEDIALVIYDAMLYLYLFTEYYEVYHVEFLSADWFVDFC